MHDNVIHEVKDGACVTVLCDKVLDSGAAVVRSMEPGVPVHWYKAEKGTWHEAVECWNRHDHDGINSPKVEAKPRPPIVPTVIPASAIADARDFTPGATVLVGDEDGPVTAVMVDEMEKSPVPHFNPGELAGSGFEGDRADRDKVPSRKKR